MRKLRHRVAMRGSVPPGHWGCRYCTRYDWHIVGVPWCWWRTYGPRASALLEVLRMFGGHQLRYIEIIGIINGSFYSQPVVCTQHPFDPNSRAETISIPIAHVGASLSCTCQSQSGLCPTGCPALHWASVVQRWCNLKLSSSSLSSLSLLLTVQLFLPHPPFISPSISPCIFLPF